MSLSWKEPAQRFGVAAADHTETFTGLPADEDGHAAMATPQAGFVDHQDTAAAALSL